ncbi:MAG: SEC-C metal-binding domain-containing protein [Candidatus Cybelea sp.]
METLGRNDPCPCGSGKKYKRCCLSAANVTPLRFPQEARQRAWGAVCDYARRFTEEIATQQAIFLGSEVAGLPANRRDVIRKNEQLAQQFVAWYICESEVGNRNVCDEFLQRKWQTLTPAERRYLEAMRKTHLGLYEVESVVRDEGLGVTDCLSGERLDIRERLFTHQAVPHEIVALRLMSEPDGTLVIDGPGLAGFQHADKDALVAQLRRLGSGAAEQHTPAIVRYWALQILTRVTRFTTTTGDPTMFCTLRFEVLDAPALRAALAAIRTFQDEGDGRYAWVRGRERIVHAHLRLDGNLLIVETLSERRAAAARSLIEQRCGAAVAFRRMERKTPEDAVAAHRATSKLEPGGKDADELPADVQAAILAPLQERHYREWTDVPLPALSGKTPREATRFRLLRAVLVGLLKDFSAESERERQAGRPAYDFSWMWGELGIDPADPLNTRTRPRPVAAGRTIYQLKITLTDTKPPIWRRVLVDGSERLDRLHMILNMAMGWSDGHLHLFSVGRRSFAYPDRELGFGDEREEDERKVRLHDLRLRTRSSFRYEYDFGDGWSHRVTVERIDAAESNQRYPACIGGRHACPPEDVGGPRGYLDFIDSPERQAQFGYKPGTFDSEAFDIDDINEGLRKLPKRWQPMNQ